MVRGEAERWVRSRINQWQTKSSAPSDFVNEVLGIDDFKINYNIYREKDDIDLLIETENSVIIIENKIKSKINGGNSLSSGKKESQLSKYVNNTNKKYGDKKIYFYIFAPDYNQINLDIYEKGNKQVILLSEFNYLIVIMTGE